MKSNLTTIGLVLLFAVILGALYFGLFARAPEPAGPGAAQTEGAPEPQAQDDASSAPVETAGETPVPEEAPAEGRRVYGVVQDAKSGMAIEGAEVYVRVREMEGELPRAKSDAAGAYELLQVADSKYVHCRAAGYAPARKELTRDSGDTRLDFSLQPGGSIAGTVSGSREPIAGVEVSAGPATGSFVDIIRNREEGGLRSGTTNADGAYVIDGLVPNSYMLVVRARSQGFLFAPEQVLTLTIQEAEQVEGVDFALERGAIVRGRVSAAGGPSLAKVKVEIIPANLMQTAMKGMDTLDMTLFEELRGESNSDGRYEIGGLGYETEYRLRGEAPDYATAVSQSFSIKRSESPLNFDFQLTTGSTVSGMVVTAEDSPVPDVRVSLMPGTDNMFLGVEPQSEKTDSAGAFRFEHVSAGTYTVFAGDHPDFAPMQEEKRGVEITPDGIKPVQDLRIVLEEKKEVAARSISGVVLDTGGQPAPDVNVTATVSFTPIFSRGAKSGPDGRFEIGDLDTTSYDVLARTQTESAKQRFVTPGADITLQLGPPTSVSGVVVDKGNRPGAYAEVTLKAVNGDTQNPMQGVMSVMGSLMGGSGQRAESNGYFVFEDVDPGEYMVKAKSPTLGAGSSTPFNVMQGEATTNIRVVLEPGVSVEGTVSNKQGQLVAGAVIRLIPAEDGDLAGMMATFMPTGLQQGVSGTSDTEGRFALRDVAAGTYLLTASHRDYAKVRVENFAVEGGRNIANYRITLSTGGSAHGIYAPGGVAKPGTMLILLTEGGIETTMTDAQGGFSFGKLPSGSAMIFPIDIGGSMEDLIAATQLAPLLEVEEDGNAEIDFDPPAEGTQVGGVVSGAPGSMTAVSIRKPGGPDFNMSIPTDFRSALEARRYQVGFGLVGDDGTFVVENVPPGEYILDVISMDIDLENPDPMQYMNLDPAQIPHVTQTIHIGPEPTPLNVVFPAQPVQE